MDRGAWWAAVHGVTKSWTQLSDFTFTFHFHALEKEMATHSSVLAWRIPGTGEPAGLLSMGSWGRIVWHDWSDLAAATGYLCSLWIFRSCVMLEDDPWPRTILFPDSIYNLSNIANPEICSKDHVSTLHWKWVTHTLSGSLAHVFCKENVKNRKQQWNELPDSLTKCLPQELWLPFVTCRFKLQVLKLQVYSLIDPKAKHG